MAVNRTDIFYAKFFKPFSRNSQNSESSFQHLYFPYKELADQGNFPNDIFYIFFNPDIRFAGADFTEIFRHAAYISRYRHAVII